MKKLFFVGLIFISIKCFSQFGVTGYIENVYGLNYKIGSRINADLKFYANQVVFKSVPIEINGTYDLFQKEKYNFYLGLGLIYDPITQSNIDYDLPIGFEIKPFDSLKNISIIMELEPWFDTSQDFTLHKLFGLRYSFK
jgi:hypothetical protein